MSGSTSIIDQIDGAQAQNVVTANANFDAASAAMAFGRHGSACVALTWGIYGGAMLVSGVPTQIANQTIALTASATNYLYLTSSGVLTKTTSLPSGWPGPLASNAVALYSVVTGTAAVTSYQDWRVASATGPMPAVSGTGFVYATSGTMDAAAKSATAATALLNAVVGDSGSGGTKGLVPAPAAGDAAQNKVLHADGTFKTVDGGSISASGYQAAIQSYLGRRRVTSHRPLGNTFKSEGCGDWTNSASGGSIAGGSLTDTNFLTQSERVRFTSATSVNSIVGRYVATNHSMIRGNASRLGGFVITALFGFSTINSDSRWAVGLRAATGLPSATVEPSTLVSSIMVGQDSTDANIQVIAHDASSGLTKTSLGGSFARPSASDWFEVTFSAQANGGTIEYSVTNCNTGVTITGSASANLPAAGTRLYFTQYATNGPTTASAIALDLGNAWLETGY